MQFNASVTTCTDYFLASKLHVNKLSKMSTPAQLLFEHDFVFFYYLLLDACLKGIGICIYLWLLITLLNNFVNI